MTEYKPVPIARRVWLHDRMEELRDELDLPQRAQLLVRLSAMSYTEWLASFVQNCEGAAAYAAGTKAERRRERKSRPDSYLLMHHAAMFMVGLHELAQSKAFPDAYTRKDERFQFETSAIAVAIRTWDDIDAHVECSLFWQFDDPECSSGWPFKQE